MTAAILSTVGRATGGGWVLEYQRCGARSPSYRLSCRAIRETTPTPNSDWPGRIFSFFEQLLSLGELARGKREFSSAAVFLTRAPGSVRNALRVAR